MAVICLSIGIDKGFLKYDWDGSCVTLFPAGTVELTRRRRTTD